MADFIAEVAAQHGDDFRVLRVDRLDTVEPGAHAQS